MTDIVRSAAQVLRSALMSFDVSVPSAEDCAALADELAATEKACAAVRLLAVQRAAAHGLHREKGFADAVSWVARQGGTTSSQARQALQTAAELEGCEATRQALLAGELSIAQAHEITSAEAESPGQEAALLAAAKGTDLSRLRDQVRARRVERTSREELHRLQHRSRRFRHWRDGIGMVCFEGALPPEIGVPFVNRIDELARRHRRAAREDAGCREPFEACAADVIASSLVPSGDVGSQPRRAELVVVCDLSAYRRGHVHPGETCHIIDGGPVPVSVARDVAEDAFVKAVLHDGTRILVVEHFGRHLPAELKTALDLGPVPAFTGRQCADCGRRYGLEYDHVDPVANRGPTSYANIEARCYADHQAKTERDRRAGLLGKRQRRSRVPSATSVAPAARVRRTASVRAGPGPSG